MHNVIVNGNDFEKMNLILKQIKNLRDAMPDGNIEIVFTRSAVKALLKNYENIDKINDLIKSGIKFFACENSLKELKIDKSELAGNIGTVRAGVMEIVEKQELGYSYLQL
ncbi:DsrE family protein [Picrophilus oshimae]|uniref:DsrE family protein n=1 Tax=Picrophilus oshimae TaxID=46632 RepID=UPI00064E731F|nr:DsrE family protein [Picrophilus oshimae]